jgi:hypothetical protein
MDLARQVESCAPIEYGPHIWEFFDQGRVNCGEIQQHEDRSETAEPGLYSFMSGVRKSVQLFENVRARPINIEVAGGDPRGARNICEDMPTVRI